MIERKFVAEKLKMLQVKQFMAEHFGKGKYSHIEIKKTPLGEKIIVYTSRPGLIVGKHGENIKSFTHILKERFNMENPQIEVAEVNNPYVDAQTMADHIVGVLERFGPKRFKSVGYKTLQMAMDAGARGIEIHIGGRGVPSSRARTTRFYSGYLKKCGDVAVTDIQKGKSVANLKSGSVGVDVSIMLPDTLLPDRIIIKGQSKTEQSAETAKAEVKEEKKEEEKPKKAAKPRAKKPKKEEKSEAGAQEKTNEAKNEQEVKGTQAEKN